MDPNLSSSSCHSVSSTEDPTTPTSAALDAECMDAADPAPEPVPQCCLCHVARQPLVALAYEGNLHQACQACWALHSVVQALAQLPPDCAEVRTITDAATTVWEIARAAVSAHIDTVDP